MKLFSEIALLVGFALPSISMAELVVPSFFSDNMVLQQNRDAMVWGKATPNADVSIGFGGSPFFGTADEKGNWRIAVTTGAANAEGQVMTITSDGEAIEINDILVGEVWLASGQSNMAFPLSRVPEYVERLKTIDIPGVRMFCAKPTAAAEPQDDIDGEWLLPASESGNSMSAVAFFFAKKLHDDLGVPVGILKTAWGGKPIETFASREALSSLPETKAMVELVLEQEASYDPVKALNVYKQRMKHHKGLVRQWLDSGKTKGTRPPRTPVQPKPPLMTEGKPGVLFDGMIHPFVGYTMSGAIWYQGEANAKIGQVPYDVTLPLMIRDWRSRWGDEFAFLYVQLASYRHVTIEPGSNDPWPLLQDRMRRALETTPKTGMAVINDVGNATDIHPKDKKTPGERLAVWALAKTYGRDVIHSGPLFVSSVRENGAVAVEFTSVGEGLKTRDDKPLKRFEIAGADRVWHWGDAVIVGKSIVQVTCPAVRHPVAVRYAWAANPADANLVNSAGLPTSIFRTDDWDDVEAPVPPPRVNRVKTAK